MESIMERYLEHKVGIRILSDPQLENVLPTFSNLLDKVKVCREAAKKDRKGIKGHYQYNFMYDNVFSVLGQRGTGKTSVAFTLKEKISRDYIGDVVLPLIIPEVIPENCTVLGWLLAIVSEEIEKLERKIQEEEKKQGRSACWNGCTSRNCTNDGISLTERLERMNQLFYAGSYNPGNEQSYYKAVGNSVRQAADYYLFAKEIACLWDEWVERIRYYEELINEYKNEEICPMIYFIFDDVDLAPEKIEEILSVIIKYLSHPNIIVITTADDELFLEVIENKLDKNIGRLPSEWREYLNRNSQDYFLNMDSKLTEKIRAQELAIKQTARKYLGKVLPASTRYYLKMFNNAKDKEFFCVEEYGRLGNGVAAQIQELIDSIKDVENRPQNFMEREGEIICFYLKFMGKTSRQITNVYIALKELVRVLKDIGNNKEDPVMEVYNSISFFLRTAINANHDLAQKIEQVDRFVDEAFPVKYNQWKLYINYAYLNEFLSKELDGKNRKERIFIGLSLYSLFSFVENILLIMESVLPGGITKRRKVHAVRFLSAFLQNEMTAIHYVLRVDMPEVEFFSHYSNLLDRLEGIAENEIDNKIFNLEYFYDFKEYLPTKMNQNDLKTANKKDPTWFKELIGRLFLVYGNAYLVNKSDIEKCWVYWGNSYPVRYQMVIEREIIENMYEIFSVPRLQYEWEKIVSDYKTAITEIPNIGKDALKSECIESIRDRILTEGMWFDENEERYAELGIVLNYYQDNVEDEEGILPISKYPKMLLNELLKINEVILGRSDDILRLITYYISKIEDIDQKINFRVIMNSPSYFIAVLEDIMEDNVLFVRELQELINKIERYRYYEDIKRLIIDVELYRNILDVLEDILKWNNGNRHPLNEERKNLINYVKNLMNCLSVAVDIDDDRVLYDVVSMGAYIHCVSVLQRLYIFKLVDERYRVWNSFSSKELETVMIGSKEEKTYYYNFFESACRLIEKSAVSEKALRDVVKTAYLRERRNYVKSLLPGEDNE